MVAENPDLTRLLLLFAAGGIVLAGATIDLYLAFLLQRRSATFAFPALPSLRQRPFSHLHALQVLLITLLFAVPSLFQKAGPRTPSSAMLISGSVLYALTALLIVTFCLSTAGATFRSAFHTGACSVRRALGQGVLYGLASLPPILLLSHVMSTVTEALGYDARPQEVFDWFGNAEIPWATRICLMVAAVVFAPMAEEALFRGILFPALLKNRRFAAAALLTGTYFALVHFHAVSLLPLLALSVAFSSAYAATGSLLTPIVMHALFNATSIVLYYATEAS